MLGVKFTGDIDQYRLVIPKEHLPPVGTRIAKSTEAMDITVAIPTYNGAERLPLVLEALRSQALPQNLAWEVCVIDNNSRDHTAELVQRYQEGFPVGLHYYLELEQGATFARHRAIQVATGQWVAFLDDDNIPAIDWLSQVWQFAQDHPQAGAFNGKILGQFGATLPEGFDRIQNYLAIRDHGEHPRQFQAQNLQLPPGAGLVVQRSAWLATVPKVPKILGNRAGRIARGEDYEPLLYMHRAGWQIWYAPAVCITHMIPAERLARPYLEALARSCGLATYGLLKICHPPRSWPWLLARTVLGNLRRIGQHWWRYKLRGKSSLVTDCELEFFWGSLLSPFVRS